MYYLTHGAYPPEHWSKTKAVVELDTAAIAAQHVAPSWSPPPPKPPKLPPPDGLTPTRKLLKAITDAGGLLELDARDDTTNYQSLVGMINRHKMAPNGQELIMMAGRTYHHKLFRLSDVSDWQTTSPTDVVAAERIARWHPAVATLRSDKRLDHIDKELRGRAFRLLHALAREAEARGHTVRPPQRNSYGYIDDRSKLHGDLIIKVGEIECSVDIVQPSQRVPHEPTADELKRRREYEWSYIPSYDSVPFAGLAIALDTNSRWSSKVTWSEKKGSKLATRLPDVLTTFERWAVIDAERNEAERRAAIEKQERDERENEQARQAFVEHKLGERFVADMKAWELAGRLRAYLDVLRQRAAALTDDAERMAAEEWLQWCENYVAQHDPAQRAIIVPTVKPPDYSELAEFRTRLGFNSFGF